MGCGYSSVSKIDLRRFVARGKKELTFLQQHNPRKPIVQIPEIHRAHSPLVVQLAIDIKRLVRFDLHLPHPLSGDGSLARTFATGAGNTTGTTFIERGVELVAPGRAVRVAIAVVVAEEVVTAGLLAPLYGKRLVDGGEEVFGQVGGEGDKGVEVVGGVFWIEAAEEVAAGQVSLAGWIGRRANLQ